MAVGLPVVVYGGSEIFIAYFNAIVLALGDSSFHLIFKITLLLAGVTAIFSAITKRDFLTCVKWFGLYYFVFYILFTPRVTVQIYDQTDPGRSNNTIDNVPLGLAALASITTTIGDSLTQLTDKVFRAPDDLRYSQSGMMMASKMVLAGNQFQITDTKLSENLQSFVNQCVFYDLLLKKYTIEDLFNASNLWEFISGNASKARSFLYNGTVTTCAQGMTGLGNDLNISIDKSATLFGKLLFPNAKNDNDAKAQLLKYLPMSYEYLTGLSGSAADMMRQNFVANAIQNGAIRFGAVVNAPAALQAYSYTRSQEQQRLTYQTLGESASYWLPIMKNAFEAIMYGCFIFIVLLSIFPFGLSILKNYVFTLIWIQTWAPLYAVINMICSYYAQARSSALTHVITLQSLSSLTQINQDMASLAGYLTLSVPFLAAGLVKGMSGTMTQLAQYIGGVQQSAAGSAASEAASGNFNMGNTSFNNHSSFNTSANHFDTAGHVSSGMSYQMPGGESMSIMPNGTAVMDRRGVMSNLGVDLNLADSIRNTAMQQADQSYNTALSNSEASSHASSAAARSLSELSQHAGKSSSSGDGWVYSASGAVNDSLHNVKELTEKFANEHHISFGEAANVLSSVYGQLQGGISGELGLKGGSGQGGAGGVSSGSISGAFNLAGERNVQHNQLTEKSNLYSDAKDFINNTSYARNRAQNEPGAD